MVNRPKLLIGTSSEIGHVGTVLGIPSVNVNEDDAYVISTFCKISYPWSTHILSPRVCDNGSWEKKSIKYESYHELAYLHPGNFKASKETVREYLNPDQPYFLLRFGDIVLAQKVAGWMIRNMQASDSHFYFRKFSRYTIKTSFMR